jgi:hypothetical protein
MATDPGDRTRHFAAIERKHGLPASHTDFLAAQDPSWTALDRCRERDECLAKLVGLGLVHPTAPA